MATALPAALAACDVPALGSPKAVATRTPVVVRFTTPGNPRLTEAWQPLLDAQNKAGAWPQLQYVSAEQEVARSGGQSPAGLAGRVATYRDWLAAQAAAASGPDVLALPIHDLLAFQERGAVADLTGLAKARKPAELQLDDFWPDQLDACRVKGSLFALPWQGDALLLYFNDALFQARGVPTPRDLLTRGSWTWQTFLESAQRVAGPLSAAQQDAVDELRRPARRATGNPAPAPAAPRTAPVRRSYGTDRGSWETWVWSNGGEVLDATLSHCLLDGRDAVDGLAFMAALATKYQVVPSVQELRGTSERTMFDAGLLGMFFDTRDAVLRLARQVDGTWDAVPVPAGKRGSLSRLNLSVFTVAAASAAPEAAFEAVRYLTSAEAQRQWLKRGDAVPSRKSAATSPEFQHFSGPTQATERANASFVDVIRQGSARLLPLLSRWPELQMAINRELRPLLNGDREAPAAAQGAKDAVERLLAG